MKKKNVTPVEIECSNTHSTLVFSDFLNEVQSGLILRKKLKMNYILLSYKWGC